ncbi:MAG: Gfo/Idh/MocA family oxidoreductase, partial [Flavobacteriaceae bacterium]|nr:Gfo/Idh/MocA family oxidoreductase [Flavobacteriaceae bacterium]
SPEKIPVWKRRYGISDRNIYTYENMHEASNNEDIDVMYIVTPNALHKEHSIKAANAGKHVWCEKPMATTVEDCRKIIAACEDNKVRLMIGYRMQHEPITQTVINWGKTNPYGKINSLSAEAGFRSGGFNTNHWKLYKKLGGGAMFDMGVYPLNAARYATRMEPVAVGATQKIYRDEIFEADEETVFDLTFPNGIKAHCKTSFAENINLLDVQCENGWYKLKPMQSYSGVQGMTSDGKVLSPFSGIQQVKQMDDDALAIINKTPAIVPGEEGLKDIIVVDAIFKSARENGKTISL